MLNDSRGAPMTKAEIQALMEKLEIAASALEYYSHPDHYEEWITLTSLRPAGVLTDRGDLAREALKKIRKEK